MITPTILSFIVILIAANLFLVTAVSTGNSWKFVGPSAAKDVQPTMDVSSAANDVVKVGNAFLLATVNGGVWRTTDATTTARPHWVNVFDSQPVTCSSMTSLHVSAFKSNTVYAACGASSSSLMGYQWNVRNTGDFAGFAVSTDAGLTWKMANFPPNYSVEDILELPNGNVVAAVRGGYFDDDTVQTGGIWVSNNIFDQASWKKTSTTPSFHLRFDNTSNTIYSSSAAVADTNAVQYSTDNGQTWNILTSGLTFSGQQVPFYSCLALVPGKSLFLGVMLTPSQFMNFGITGGYGQVFYLNLATQNAQWQIVGGQPMPPHSARPTEDCSYTCAFPNCCNTIDASYSAKDRMALFVIPGDDSFLYVSGNGDFNLIWRVDYRKALGKGPCTYNTTGTTATCFNPQIDLYWWAPMWNKGPKFRNDNTNDGPPHVDTRNMGYDPKNDALIMVSDGGIYLRFNYKSAGNGVWKGWQGDIGTFEFIDIAYDLAADRVVCAAQDNNVIISATNSQQNPTAPGRSFVGGDGCAVDVLQAVGKNTPARLFGSYYNLGGLSYVLDNFMGSPFDSATYIPVEKRGFPLFDPTNNARAAASVFPFFQMPFHINRFNPDMLYFWANASAYGQNTGPGIFKLNVAVPDAKNQNATFVMASDGENIIDFKVAGKVDGKNSDDVVVAVSGSYLFTRHNGVNNKVKMPVTFAEPLVIGPKLYCDNVDFVACTKDDPPKMNWANHGSSIHLDVHPDDARVIAVTGWPDLRSNKGDESIILTRDGGKTWDTNVMGNLKSVTQTIGHARPQGLALFKNYLVVGTVHGNYACDFTNGKYEYTRLGTWTEFPRVIVSFNNYYPEKDTLVVATMGRSAYLMPSASTNVAAAIAQMNNSNNKDNGNKNKLGLIFGITIPLVVVAIIVVVWKKKQTERAATEYNYRNVEDDPRNSRALDGV